MDVGWYGEINIIQHDGCDVATYGTVGGTVGGTVVQWTVVQWTVGGMVGSILFSTTAVTWPHTVRYGPVQPCLPLSGGLGLPPLFALLPVPLQ